MFSRHIQRLIATLLLVSFSAQASAQEEFFLFGFRLHQNDPQYLARIEQQFQVKVPVVSVIYDDFTEKEQHQLVDTVKLLGTDRVYHITVNPFGYSLPELIESPDHKGWETKYRILFALIKQLHIKVIFRFLHEMNGAWYSWSSDPTHFPIFWRMVWGWSRDAGLDRSDILFDFSLNSQDLPIDDGYTPSQSAPHTPCPPAKHLAMGCYSFEDYFPGKEYVDLVGVTIYNWGEGARKEGWAKWRTPLETINENEWNTLQRMRAMEKPIYIDEAGTTSIRISGEYDPKKIVSLYEMSHLGTLESPAIGLPDKNEWITQYKQLLLSPGIVGGNYFNTDVTDGLKERWQVGELDWTAIDPDKHFAYPAMLDILKDDKNLIHPTLYFDLSDAEQKQLPEISVDRMKYIDKYVAKLFPFPEGKSLIVASDDAISDRPKKYVMLLAKKLDSFPGVCMILQKKFAELPCSTIKISQDEQTAAKAVITASVLGGGSYDQILEKLADLRRDYFLSQSTSSGRNQAKFVWMRRYVNRYETDLFSR